MKKERITEKIEQLRNELSNADQSIKERIEPIINALENEFSQPEDLVTELETKHPQLTEFVNRLSDLLSGLGI
jgi:predicted  nucleic acid-binding Zn-ribbon protein